MGWGRAGAPEAAGEQLGAGPRQQSQVAGPGGPETASCKEASIPEKSFREVPGALESPPPFHGPARVRDRAQDRAQESLWPPAGQLRGRARAG